LIDFGLGIQNVSQLANVSRQGARLAARHSGQFVPAVTQCGASYRGSCNGAQNFSPDFTTSVVDAAVIGACRAMEQMSIAEGEEYIVIAETDSGAEDTLDTSGFFIPTTQTVSVKVSRNSENNDSFCLICAEAFIPALSSESIKGYSRIILDGGCL